MVPDRPRRVACFSFYPADGPSVRHRIGNYIRLWADQGIQVEVLAFLTDRLYRTRRNFGLLAAMRKALGLAYCTFRLILRLPRVPAYDLVIIHREAFPLGSARFERLICRLNPRTVFDLDDATWTRMPLKIDQRGRFFDPDRVADTISACHAVVVGNAYLADYARRFNERVTIIPTPYRDLGGEASTSGHPVIVWIGNVGNEAYLDLLAEPLRRLARTHDFTFRVIGSPDVLSLDMPGVPLDARVWQADTERAWLQEAAIGVMPLHDREYERGKCAFKLIQYYSAGLPVVASPVGMNTEVVRPGETGFLAEDEEAWYTHLKALLEDAALRTRMGQAGYALYQEAFTPDVNAGRWLALMTALWQTPEAGK
ncbi:MAG: glycosyltransferase family 4 protein [Pseudomonadota bacterium]